MFLFIVPTLIILLLVVVFSRYADRYKSNANVFTRDVFLEKVAFVLSVCIVEMGDWLVGVICGRWFALDRYLL